MNKTMRCLLAVAGLGLLAGTAVVAQDVVRVRGTIERVEGGVYIVKAHDGTSLKLTLAPNAGIAASIKVGAVGHQVRLLHRRCGAAAGRRHPARFGGAHLP
jgi:hypothetical protein